MSAARSCSGSLVVVLLATTVLPLACNDNVPGHGSSIFAYDGVKVRRVSPEHGIYRYASIRPDGAEVVYSGGGNWPPRLWRTDLASGQTVALTPPDVAAMLPVYSADGKRIMFSSDMEQDKRYRPETPVSWFTVTQTGFAPGHCFNLFVMDRDGKNVRRVTRGHERDMRSCFSPDGHTIAFISKPIGKRPVLCVLDLNGRAPPRKLCDRAQRPWFSADGRRIYFHRHSTRAQSAVCWIAVGGGAVHPLPNSPSGITHGVFIDGDCVLVHSNHDSPDGSFRLWEIPLDGGPPRLIQPPGWKRPATHATRGKNGIICFDG